MKSFTSAFLGQQKVPQPDADIGIVLAKAKFLAYFVAYDVMAFLLDILTYILAFEAEGIETAISDFPISKSFALKICYEFWVPLFKYDFCRAEEFLPV